jgi:hypothetical protein
MFHKINVIFAFLIIIFSFYNCTSSAYYTKSGNRNINRAIIIRVISGNVNLNISGHISENIYTNNKIMNDDKGFKIIETTEAPVALQGKKTINENIILYENNEFKYTLTQAEVVIVNVRSIDNNDAKILVIEYDKNKEYIIYGNNNLGQMISFKN